MKQFFNFYFQLFSVSSRLQKLETKKTFQNHWMQKKKKELIMSFILNQMFSTKS